jgi:hypothetical protein
MVSFMKRVLVLLVHLRGKKAVDVSMESVEKHAAAGKNEPAATVAVVAKETVWTN